MTTGVLLGIDANVGPAHEIIQPETQFVRFSPSLATIKSLPGWCGDLRTVGVVNPAGYPSAVADTREQAARAAHAISLMRPTSQYIPMSDAGLSEFDPENRRTGLRLF